MTNVDVLILIKRENVADGDENKTVTTAIKGLIMLKIGEAKGIAVTGKISVLLTDGGLLTLKKKIRENYGDDGDSIRAM